MKIYIEKTLENYNVTDCYTYISHVNKTLHLSLMVHESVPQETPLILTPSILNPMSNSVIQISVTHILIIIIINFI